MNVVSSYFISIMLFLCMGLSTVNAKGSITSEKKVENAGEEGEADEKKQESGSYLENLQRRYISRLPYLMVPVMIVPIIKNGNVAGYLTIMVELKGAGVEAYRKLQADILMVRDEIFCDLYFAMSRLWLGPELPSANVLENRIKRRINKYYKSEIAEKARLHVMHLSLIHNS